MAGVYAKIIKIKFRDQRVADFTSAGSNGIIDSDWVYVQSGTNSVCFPKESISSVELGATVAHLDTALSSADALFT